MFEAMPNAFSTRIIVRTQLRPLSEPDDPIRNEIMRNMGQRPTSHLCYRTGIYSRGKYNIFTRNKSRRLNGFSRLYSRVRNACNVDNSRSLIPLRM